MTTITNQALQKVKESRKTKLLLALAFNKTSNTIENWIKNSDQMLTTPDAVRIISEETGLRIDEILLEQVAA